MVEPLRLLLICLRDLFRSRAELQSEVIVLRHQLNVLRRRKPKRVRLHWFDRALFLCLYRLFPLILHSIAIMKPENRHWLAQGGVSGVLALEIASASWAPRDRP